MVEVGSSTLSSRALKLFSRPRTPELQSSRVRYVRLGIVFFHDMCMLWVCSELVLCYVRKNFYHYLTHEGQHFSLNLLERKDGLHACKTTNTRFCAGIYQMRYETKLCIAV